MQVKHLKTLLHSQNGIARVQAIAWSPNNKRLAVADSGRFVHLFDEAGERRDKFSTKAADPKEKGPKIFVVRDMCFSPDSVKLAIAQSDFIIFVYRLGLDWGEKKSICNKFPQSSPVTCMCWPSTPAGTELIVFGTLEGKVKVAIMKTNKSNTLYSYESPVLTVAASPDGNHVISGHADNSIFRYTFESEEGGVSGANKIATHTCPPHCLAWGESIMAAGADCTITFYDRTGHLIQTFDYPVQEDREMTVADFNPSGQTLAVGATNKFRLFNFNSKSRKWEEGNINPLPNSYSFTALKWKADGSRLVTGTLCGAVDMFDACIRRYKLRGAFEFTYVSHNQVIVKRLSNGTRLVLKSHMGYEIQKVNVHHDQYLVAHTATTLLIGDLETCKLSEVQWQLTGREKFVFDNPQVCMVFAAGQLSLIEFGQNEVLGTCRTDETNMHRMAVRIHEPAPESGLPARKAIAYLIDRQTIQIDDLITGIPAARIAHTSKIDWLELNHRANKLLFRDKQRQLFLFDIITQEKNTLLNFCTYVQWVPNSDVVVAQNRVELCIWYSIDSPDRVQTVPIKGDVEGIERMPGKTEVIVDEGVSTVAYALDEALIEFGTAMEDHDYDKASDLLDQSTLSPETEAMWQQLANIALAEMKLYIAERCFAALGDVAKSHALRRINQIAEEHAKEGGYDHYTVRAELFILNKEFKRAEHLLLENGQTDKAMEMWDEMERFNESIAVAESKGDFDKAAKHRDFYFDFLRNTGQLEKAAELRESEGKHMEAINLYLKGGVPARAAHVVNAHNVKPEPQLLEAIASALFKSRIFEKAGDFFEKLNMFDRAIDAFKKGHFYRRAVELAKKAFPQEVPKLEGDWADWLCTQKQVDQAINHYIEANMYSKAIEAAITSRQWGKAVNIIETQNVGAPTDPMVQGFYKQIAHHYEEAHEFSEAEKYYIKAGAIHEAVDMYSRRGMSDHMYRVAQRNLNAKQLVELFVDQAQQLEAKGDHSGAERIYLKVNEPEKAIVMYKKARDFNSMVRLVASYRPNFLQQTHLSLAGQFEKEGNLKLAEQHYINGKDWTKAVNMYRDRNMWDDAVRVAKVHGGAQSAKQVVLAKAKTVDAEEGVRLLMKFSLVEGGIESAIEEQKYDLALQWGQLALPSRLPYIYLKQAMNFEDLGEFRLAEEAFIKAQKPREAIDMYVHQHEFDSALRVAENYDQSAIAAICTAQARVCFQQGNFREAEALLLRANAAELLLKFYRDARMYQDAQRIARDYCPERLPEISKEVALATSDPIQAGAMLEDNGEYQLAIEAYLRASRDTTADVNHLVAVWSRAVKLCLSHARPLLKEVLKSATTKMLDIGRAEEAGKCMEEAEDYKGAINVYVRGQKYELAEALAQRISPELVEHVKRAKVQEAMKDNSAAARDDLEYIDKDAALKAHVASNDWEKALKLARGMGAEQARTYAAMYVQFLTREGDLGKALSVIARDGMDTNDFRFFETWSNLAAALVTKLPSRDFDLSGLHQGLIEVVENMRKMGQPNQDTLRAAAMRDVIHIYHTFNIMVDNGFPDIGLKLMLGLPRYVNYIPPDKCYYDAGMAAKDAGNDSLAFLYLNRYLDICEKIDDGEPDSSNMDNSDFAVTDFPFQFQLPKQCSIDKETHEDANKWVLTTSVTHDLDPNLPQVTCPVSGQPMFEGSLQSPGGKRFDPCAISGYPVMGSKVQCKNCQRPANQEDWNRFIMVAKTCPWCGAPQSPDFKMGNL